MTWRPCRLQAFVRETATCQSAPKMNLVHKGEDDPCVLKFTLDAADELHLSHSRCRVWFGRTVGAGLVAAALFSSYAMTNLAPYQWQANHLESLCVLAY